MSLTKPILNSTAAWDKANGNTFTFSVNGGDQVTGNTLYIIDNATNLVVYTLATTSFRYAAEVPPNASGLTNGTYYSAYITTTNANGDISPQSNIIQFYCYTSPAFQITNVSEGATINSTNVTPILEYNQIESEKLNSYQFILYNASQIELSSSGVLYVGSEQELPLNLSYTFAGLNDNTVYFIRATGVTVENTLVDTGYIRFVVSIETPSIYSQFIAVNNCKNGYITYSSNVVAVEGEGFNIITDPLLDTVDATAEDAYIKWAEGFSLESNFTFSLWFLEPNFNKTLATLIGDNENYIQISTIEDTTGFYINIDVYYKRNIYNIFSSSVLYDVENEYCMRLTKIDNLYDIELAVVV